MTVRIDRGYRGPPRSGNGGYTAGLLAGHLTRTSGGGSDAVQVRLHRPPPLDVELEVQVDVEAGTAELRHGSTTIATARPGQLAYEPAKPVPYELAADSAASYVTAADHPFPGCFVCGPERAEGGGLRIFAGQYEPGRTAAAWCPQPSTAGTAHRVPDEIVWAALDCPGGWTADLAGRPMVLGTMTAQVLRRPRIGERCVVTGRRDATDDRRAWTSTALYGTDGDLLGRAEAIWVVVDVETFNQLSR